MSLYLEKTDFTMEDINFYINDIQYSIDAKYIPKTFEDLYKMMNYCIHENISLVNLDYCLSQFQNKDRVFKYILEQCPKNSLKPDDKKDIEATKTILSWIIPKGNQKGKNLLKLTRKGYWNESLLYINSSNNKSID